MKNQAGMHKEDIKAAIRKLGKTLQQLSLDNDLHGSAVQCALRRPFPSADKAISDFIGVPLHNIWPDRYDADGQRIRSRRGRLPRESAPVTAKNPAS